MRIAKGGPPKPCEVSLEDCPEEVVHSYRESYEGKEIWILQRKFQSVVKYSGFRAKSSIWMLET